MVRNTTAAWWRGLAIGVAGVLAVTGCSSAKDNSSSSSGKGSIDTAGLSRQVDAKQKTAPARFTVQPGTEEATVVGAKPKDRLSLVDAQGKRLVILGADKFGQAHFAYVPTQLAYYQTGANAKVPSVDGGVVKAGSGYTVRDESTTPVTVSKQFAVAARDDDPPSSFYDKLAGKLGPTGNQTKWYGYVPMRDGVQLSVNIVLPGPADKGPYPTVVEYSGYGPANPGAQEPGSMIAGLLGYATIGVNMRGSGCSGGVFDVFNASQQSDGYDTIEDIARQPWVDHHKPGMVGLSYSGITQLYVASTRPPHLAAITSLSVIKDPWLEQWPGGVYNGGFTKSWLNERDAESAPGGTSWVSKQVKEGDKTCTAALKLREQNLDFGAFGRSLVHRPAAIDERDLSLLVRKIDVPVYLTGAWQDEQTGPQFTDMLDHFTSAPVKRFTLFNGRHPDGYTPLVLTRWYEFLELFVHKKVPRIAPAIRAAAPEVFKENFGVAGLKFEPDRFAKFKDDQYAAVLKAYEAEPDVRVLFESGAGGKTPGAPIARFEASFPSWPPPQAKKETWYFGSGGTLSQTKPTAGGVDQFANEPKYGKETFFGPKGYQLLAPVWDLDWKNYDAGKGLSYLSPKFTSTTVAAGPAQADLWIAAKDKDADVQATV
ncbi:MAG TPA: CocE/NonD family hydrolase, partial [Acidimicrobiales bacterium]